MFKPKIRGSLLDALERMGNESGRDPNELLEELLTTATDATPPPNGGAKAAPVPAPAARAPNAAATSAAAAQSADVSIPRPGGGRIARVTVVPHPEGPRMGETIAQAKRRESGQDEDDQSARSASDETDDAPKMRANKPNPLPLPSSKQWAGTKEPSDAPSTSKQKKPADEDEETKRARLRAKYTTNRGRLQNR